MNKPLITLCLLLLLTTTLRAQTWENVAFDVSGPAPLAGRTLTVTDVNGSVVFTGTLGLVEWSGASGVEGYARASVPLFLDDNAAQVWTFTTAGWTAQVDLAAAIGAWNDAQPGGGTPGLGLAFQPTGAVPVQEFLLPAERSGHALGLAQPGSAGGPPVPTGITLGGTVEGLAGTYHYGAAAFDPAKAFWVVDFTTGERAPENGTHLVSPNWSSDPTPYPLQSVTFYLDPEYSGYSFTLHYQTAGQPEMVQALTAWPCSLTGGQTMGNGQVVNVTGAMSVTGSVARGASYWLTLDYTGAPIGPTFGPFASAQDPLHWSLLSAPPPLPPPLQTHQFYVPAGMTGGYIHQPSVERPLSEVVSSSYIEDYDAEGDPHFFYYDVRTADIDPGEPFRLEIDGTEVSQGERWYYAGWFPSTARPAASRRRPPWLALSSFPLRGPLTPCVSVLPIRTAWCWSRGDGALSARASRSTIRGMASGA